LRPGKGSQFYWKDICNYRTFSYGSGSSAVKFDACDGFGMLDFIYGKRRDW
jgi:hypothetical protein